MKILELFKKKTTKEKGLLLFEELAVALDEEEQTMGADFDEQSNREENAQSETEERRLISELIKLTGEDAETLKRNFLVYNAIKILSKVGRAVVRSDALEEDMKGIFTFVRDYRLGGLIVSPVYLQAAARFIKKYKGDIISVGAIVDFPFGEATLKSKQQCVKAAAKAKADFAIITCPTMLTDKEKAKAFRKQIKKLCKPFKKQNGVAINASDIGGDEIKRVVKFISKTKTQILMLLFGDSSMEEVVAKVAAATANLGEKKLFVLVNAEKAEAVTELVKLGVDVVYTPFAEEISKEVVERLGLKEVKLY